MSDSPLLSRAIPNAAGNGNIVGDTSTTLSASPSAAVYGSSGSGGALMATITHEVQPGDRLASLAVYYDVPTEVSVCMCVCACVCVCVCVCVEISCFVGTVI